MDKTNITIIGCGSVGANLSFKLALLSQYNNKIRNLNLVDNDSISSKNLPFLFLSDKKLLGMPKTEVLKQTIQKINDKLNINSYISTFPNINDNLFESYMIDCRDTKDSNDLFDLKLNLDGPYGVITTNPKNNNINNLSDYIFENYPYYSDLFSSLICHLFFDVEFENNKTQQTIINLNLPFGGTVIDDYIKFGNDYTKFKDD